MTSGPPMKPPPPNMSTYSSDPAGGSVTATSKPGGGGGAHRCSPAGVQTFPFAGANQISSPRATLDANKKKTFTKSVRRICCQVI